MHFCVSFSGMKPIELSREKSQDGFNKENDNAQGGPYRR